MNPKRFGILTTTITFVFCFAGCGSSGSSGSNTTPPPATYTIGGSITGLTASGLVLADGSQTVSPTSGATSFTFPTAVASGTNYSVTVQTQPSGEICSVAGGSGTTGSSNVTSVVVSCATAYTIGGTISGVTASGLVLDDGSQTESPASGQKVSPALDATSFTFPMPVVTGTDYSVNVFTRPSGEICSVINGSGIIGSSNVTNVAVSCSATKESVLYNFGGEGAGFISVGLIMDSSGNLYGTMPWFTGGACTAYQKCGIVFKLTPGNGGTYTETTLHTFQGGNSDGASPEASLLMDSNGNLYGTTYAGGPGFCESGITLIGCGSVFKLTPGSGGTYTETILYTFQGQTIDGSYPLAGLIMDGSKNLYGTTAGERSVYYYGSSVFKLTPGSGGTYTESLLHTFTSDTSDGGGAPEAGLIMDGNGNLYGTTFMGYSNSGTVFKLIPGSGGTYTESVLHIFQGGTSDGAFPEGSLVVDGSGNLYGTTSGGGSGSSGIVFKLTPGSGGTYTESILHEFQGGTSDGSTPLAGLIMDGSGNLYGTTSGGGSGSSGTVFKLTPGSGGTYTESILHSFLGQTSDDGASPAAGLMMDGSGNLYGTTFYGGIYGDGTAFEITP
jgi:uncharacterized repeat protein (TIGR03803 family)